MPAFKTYKRGGKVRVRYLTQDQATLLMERLPAHQREVVLFALTTGLCQGNILGLTWDQVHLDQRLVMIEQERGGGAGRPLERGGARCSGSAARQA